MYLTEYLPNQFYQKHMSYENGRKPDLNFFRPWGCAAYVHDPSHKQGKLGQRGKNNIFLRYLKQSKGYVFLSVHERGGVTKFESIDVTFLENEFPKKCEVGKNLSL